jgi:AraC-like DNA-binding protein
MKTRQKKTDFQIEFNDGGKLARRRTGMLPDGTYLFEDELAVEGVLTAPVITCAAWLLELYKLQSGKLCFITDNQQVRPYTQCFGVLYPPFSIAQPYFKDAQGRLIGIAANHSLPPELMTAPTLFEAKFTQPPSDIAQVLEILQTGEKRQSVALNSKPSLLSLKAKRLIDENYLVYPSIARIAARLGVTHEHLSRQFKRDFTLSPSNYFRQLRVADAPLRLARGEEIINVSYEVGYNDLSRFYKQFRETTNTSPSACKTIMQPGRTS